MRNEDTGANRGRNEVRNEDRYCNIRKSPHELDRLLYHGTPINIQGPSWRLHQHNLRQAELARQLEGRSDTEADTEPAADPEP